MVCSKGREGSRGIRVVGCRRTRCGDPDSTLDLDDQVFEGLRWTGPEDEAVAGILEARFDAGIFAPEEDGVDCYAWECGIEEFGSLLDCSGIAVGVVACLYLGLMRFSIMR